MNAVKLKKVLIDPSFWILLLANVYLVYKYEQNPAVFTTLIWLYWSQSVLYGLFNFVDILTVREVEIPGQPALDLSGTLVGGKGSIKAATAWIFLFHYGFFHLVYFIFLFTMKSTGPFDWVLFKYYIVVFLAFQLINFIQHKIYNKRSKADIGKMFSTPYLRIIPMHLCILIPAFLHITNLTIFLVLKVITDVLMYLVTSSPYKRNPMAEITALNIKSTIFPD
jgi:hypothetical protein